MATLYPEWVKVGALFRAITPTMGNQMEKHMEHEIEPGNILGGWEVKASTLTH